MAIANVTNTANMMQMKSATIVLSSTSTHGNNRNYKENSSADHDHDNINVDGSSSITTLTLTDAGSITSVPHISNFDHRYTMHTATQRKGKMSRINRNTKNSKKKTNPSRKNLRPSLHLSANRSNSPVSPLKIASIETVSNDNTMNDKYNSNYNNYNYNYNTTNIARQTTFRIKMLKIIHLH